MKNYSVQLFLKDKLFVSISIFVNLPFKNQNNKNDLPKK